MYNQSDHTMLHLDPQPALSQTFSAVTVNQPVFEVNTSSIVVKGHQIGVVLVSILYSWICVLVIALCIHFKHYYTVDINAIIPLLLLLHLLALNRPFCVIKPQSLLHHVENQIHHSAFKLSLFRR